MRGSPSPITTPVIQDNKTAADTHDLFKIMLDQNHRDAASVDIGNGLDLLCGLGVVEAGQRLIQQDHFRIDRKRPRQFEPLQLAERQCTGKLALGTAQSDLVQDIRGPLAFAAPIDMQHGAERVRCQLITRAE